MSRRERNLKNKNTTTISTESINKKEMAPVKTSQSMNTESYEYYNQKTTSKKNITESPYNTLNQQSNSRYSSNNQNSNSKIISQRRVEQNRTHKVQNQYCTCDQSNDKLEHNDVPCTCPEKDDQNFCTCECEHLGEENMRNSSGKANYNYQLKKQQKIVSSSNYSSSNNNMNQNSRTYHQVSRQSGGHNGKVVKSTIETNKKIITYVSPHNPRLQISEERDINSTETGRRFEANICTCGDHDMRDMHDMHDMEGSTNVKRVENYTYYDSSSKEGNRASSRSKNDIYKYNKHTYEYKSNTNRSHSSDSRFVRQRMYKINTIFNGVRNV